MRLEENCCPILISHPSTLVLVSLTLFSPYQKAYKAVTLSDQVTLFSAAALAMFQHIYPTLFNSFSTVLLQVVFGLPLTFQPSGIHLSAVMQSFSPSLLSTCMCPNQFFLFDPSFIAPIDRSSLDFIAFIIFKGSTRLISFFNVSSKMYLVDLPGYGYVTGLGSKRGTEYFVDVAERYLKERAGKE